MNSHRFAVVALVVLLAVNAAEAHALEIKLEKKSIREGDFVNLHVTATKGLLTIENGIENKSFTENHQGFQTIALGRIKEPGIYTVRATQGKESQAIVFVVMPESGKWELAPIVLTCEAKPSKTAFQKLADGATKARLQAAAKKGFEKWSAKNVKLSPRQLKVPLASWGVD